LGFDFFCFYKSGAAGMPLIVSGPWMAHLTMALRNQTPTTRLRHQGRLSFGSFSLAV